MKPHLSSLFDNVPQIFVAHPSEGQETFPSATKLIVSKKHFYHTYLIVSVCCIFKGVLEFQKSTKSTLCRSSTFYSVLGNHLFGEVLYTA